NSGDGIWISASNTIVQGNFIGINSAGDTSVPNRGNGISIQVGNDNMIGGPGPAEGNVISGNGAPPSQVGDGIQVSGGADHTMIYGNLIGTDATGTKKVGNNAYGISVELNVTNTQIGGSNLGEGNVISGNKIDGIYLSPGSTNTH